MANLLWPPLRLIAEGPSRLVAGFSRELALSSLLALWLPSPLGLLLLAWEASVGRLCSARLPAGRLVDTTGESVLPLARTLLIEVGSEVVALLPELLLRTELDSGVKSRGTRSNVLSIFLPGRGLEVAASNCSTAGPLKLLSASMESSTFLLLARGLDEDDSEGAGRLLVATRDLSLGAGEYSTTLGLGDGLRPLEITRLGCAVVDLKVEVSSLKASSCGCCPSLDASRGCVSVTCSNGSLRPCTGSGSSAATRTLSSTAGLTSTGFVRPPVRDLEGDTRSELALGELRKSSRVRMGASERNTGMLLLPAKEACALLEAAAKERMVLPKLVSRYSSSTTGVVVFGGRVCPLACKMALAVLPNPSSSTGSRSSTAGVTAAEDTSTAGLRLGASNRLSVNTLDLLCRLKESMGESLLISSTS